MLRTIVFLAASVVLASAASAAPCDEPQPGFDTVHCFAKVYMALDQQLNVNYKFLMTAIPAAGRGVLRDGQRAWIAKRDR